MKKKTVAKKKISSRKVVISGLMAIVIILGISFTVGLLTARLKNFYSPDSHLLINTR